MGQGLCTELGKNSLYYQNLSELEHHLSRLRVNDPSLVELDLANRFLGVQGAEVGSSALISNTHLRVLNLSYNKLEGALVGKLTKCLEVNASVNELSLSGNPLGEEGAKVVADLLVQNQTIRVLKLFNCGLNDFAALHLANALQANRALEELCLDMNDLTDAAVEMLSKALKRNMTVVKLTLTGNGQLSDRYMSQIEQSLEANRRTREETLMRREKKDAEKQVTQEVQEEQRRVAEEQLQEEREQLELQHQELEEKRRQEEAEEERLDTERAGRSQEGLEKRRMRQDQMDNYVQTVVSNAYRWRDQLDNSPSRKKWWSGFTPRPIIGEVGEEDLGVDPYLPERRLVPEWKEPENPGMPPELKYRYPHVKAKPKETAATFFSAQAKEAAAGGY